MTGPSSPAPHNAPLVLVGTGRCGSTLVYSYLAMHPEFAWMSSWLTILPGFPSIVAGNRLWRIPGSDRLRETRFAPKPVEPNRVLEHWVGEVGEVLGAGDVDRLQHDLGQLVRTVCRYHGANRFLAKTVGRPVMVNLFRLVFPGTRFLHVTRDLRPTVKSLIQVDFFHAEGFESWPWDQLPASWLRLFVDRGRPVELEAAIRILLNRRELTRQLELVEASSAMELAYSRFIHAPRECLEEVGQWAEVKMPEAFLQRIDRRRLTRNRDDDWRAFFTTAQLRNLEELEALAEGR